MAPCVASIFSRILHNNLIVNFAHYIFYHRPAADMRCLTLVSS
jgi:hypothetical protein